MHETNKATYRNEDNEEEDDGLENSVFPDTSTEVSHEDDERDEVREIKKYTSKDTNKVRVWRAMVTCLLLATGAAVVFTSYTFLTREEEYKFKQAVSIIPVVHPNYDTYKPSYRFCLHSCPMNIVWSIFENGGRRVVVPSSPDSRSNQNSGSYTL
jgi:hypothetical protein